jgi:DNA-binding transcriptional ArsR family regulator
MTDPLDLTFAALADGKRRSMIAALSQGPRSVSEIAAPLDMALPSAVKHLTLLERARLVRSLKSGRVRTYALADTAFADIDAWVAERKQALGRQFDQLDRYLQDNASRENQ